MLLRLVALSAIAIGMTGCSGASEGGPDAEVVRAPLTRLDIPPGDYFGAAWVDERHVVAAWTSGTPGEPARLVAIDPVKQTRTDLPFREQDDECWRAQENRPVRLPDGRLGFLRECQPREFENTDLSVTRHRLWATDLADGGRELLFDLGDPWFHWGRGNLYSVSVRAGMREAVVYMGTRICDGVAHADVAGVGPLTFAISDDAAGPNLDEPFRLDCPDTINARDPVWSPDGARLAVLTSVAAKGHEGFARLDAKWELVVLTPGSGTRVTLIAGLAEPGFVAWSPDGRWIALEDTQAGERATTWLVDPISGRLARLESDQRVTDLTWSPSSDALFGFVDPTPDGDVADFDVAAVVVDLVSFVQR